jgi:hypothetical protein
MTSNRDHALEAQLCALIKELTPQIPALAERWQAMVAHSGEPKAEFFSYLLVQVLARQILEAELFGTERAMYERLGLRGLGGALDVAGRMLARHPARWRRIRKEGLEEAFDRAQFLAALQAALEKHQ